MSRTRRRWWLWGIAALGAALILVAAIIAVPILTHRDQGSSNQAPQAEQWPLSAEATGDDGRDRSIRVTDDQGGEPDTSALAPGDRLIVSGAGFDPERGIYVAICAIPEKPTTKPGPGRSSDSWAIRRTTRATTPQRRPSTSRTSTT